MAETSALNRCPHCDGLLLPHCRENGSEFTFHAIRQEGEDCLLKRLGMSLPNFVRISPTNL
jgi:hypothetical protein